MEETGIVNYQIKTLHKQELTCKKNLIVPLCSLKLTWKALENGHLDLQKGNTNHLPTIHFQRFLLLMSGRVNLYYAPRTPSAVVVLELGT